MRRALAILALIPLLGIASAAFAEEGDAIERSADWVDSDHATRLGSLVYLEHHGAFRFRGDLFWRADLGTGGITGIYPPLLENSTNAGFEAGHKGDHLISSANIRLRYQPTFVIGERVRVHAIIDALDNLVLGSTPRTGAGSPYAMWSDLEAGAAPPSSSVSTLRDAIRVKALWGELSLFDIITVRLGRIPDQWGLGILRNGGFDPDDDYGAAVDRMEFMGSYAGFHFGFSWDFFIEGITSELRAQPYGQPYGYGKADDVGQWVVFAKQEPIRPEEIEKREHDLHVARRPVFDWGVMSAFRTQTASTERQERSTPLEDVCLSGPDPAKELAFDCYRMADRDVFLWYPDVWGRLLWAPKPGHLLRVELEVALVYGTISSTEFLRATDTSKDVLQAGGVLQAEYHWGPTHFGLDFGFATGDDTNGVFGIVDGSEVIDTENPSAQSFQIRNRTLTNFKMHRAFRTDHLLFREVIGGVTNAWYLKPWAQYTFWESGRYRAGARLELMYAGAFEAGGTPGGALDLGFEADITAFFRIGESFDARLVFAALFPLEGLDNDLLGLGAEPALTTQLNLYWTF